MNATLEVDDLVHAVGKAILAMDPEVSQGLERATEVVAAEARQTHDYKDRTGGVTKSTQAQPVTGAFYAGGLHGDIEADGGAAAFIHGGTRAHRIAARRAKALRFQSGGRTFFRKAVQHPGTAPDPWLAEALERKLDDAAGLVLDGACDALRDAGFEIQF